MDSHHLLNQLTKIKILKESLIYEFYDNERVIDMKYLLHSIYGLFTGRNTHSFIRFWIITTYLCNNVGWTKPVEKLEEISHIVIKFGTISKCFKILIYGRCAPIKLIENCKLSAYFFRMSATNTNTTGATQEEQLPTQPEDLANFMDQIFSQMESKFTDMAQQVLKRIDEMSSKINELESSIDTLMQQAEQDK